MCGRAGAARSAAAAAVAAVLVSVCALGSCRSGDSATPTPAEPKPGSVQVRGLAFVPSDGLERVPGGEKRRNTNATLEMVGNTDSKAAAPALFVFVENDEQIGTAKVRATAIIDVLKASLDDVEIVRNEALAVPGAERARIVEATYTCTDQERSYRVECRQLELIVQMPSAPQYGLRYGMPETDYTKADVERLISSVRITQG